MSSAIPPRRSGGSEWARQDKMASSQPSGFSAAGTALDIPFIGERTYLHSTTIWNELETRARVGTHPPNSRMAIIFRALAGKAIMLCEIGNAGQGRRIGEVRIFDGTGQSNFLLLETDEPVIRRTEGHENNLMPRVEIEGETATAPQLSVATPIELLVAMTKKLHLAQVDSKVKWLVGRLDLPLPFRPRGAITVKIANRLPKRVTLNEVFVEGERVGTIMFNALGPV